MDGSAAQRSKLSEIKLRALVREHRGGDVPEADEFAPGAAMSYDGAAWVLLAKDAGHRLGAALAWWLRHDGDELHIITDDSVEQLARRAAMFDAPISVWRADGRSLVRAVPASRPAVPAVPDEHEQYRQLIVDGGADPTVEFGVLSGEVRGLEVCRAVSDVAGTRLEVGTGAHDREVFQLMHGDEPTVEALRRVVDTVTKHRVPNSVHHPLARLAAERLIRWQIEQTPSLIDAVSAHRAAPPVPRTNLKDVVPCVAHATDQAGDALVAVCTSGVDLELVPFAADALAAGDPDAELVIVMPERDLLPLTERLAGLLPSPPRLVTL